jgi:hypothetical protein
MEFSVHPIRGERRWYYRLDGKDSEKTYPTAGDAERAGIIAMKMANKNRPPKLQLALITAIGGIGLLSFLLYLVRVYLLGG